MQSKKYKKRIFVIAGEISGENIAYEVLKDLKKYYDLDFFGIGGSRLKKLGLKTIFPMHKLSIMGIIEIIPKIPVLFYLIRKTVIAIIKYNPDLIITIDAPDFNFRVLKLLKKITPNQKVLHIVAPTVWAWKASRAKKISKYLNHLFVLYPFERKYFTPHNINTTFIGHPLFIKKIENSNFRNLDKKIISIYPGSRVNEIKRHLRDILIFINRLKNKDRFVFEIIGVDHLILLIKEICKKNSNGLNLHVLAASKHKLNSFKRSYFSIAVSGTITLELAMNNVPIICIYKLNKISYFILKLIIKVKYISLVNIIMNKAIIPELIQSNFTFKKFKREFDLLNEGHKQISYQKKMFRRVQSKLYFNKKVASKEIRKMLY